LLFPAGLAEQFGTTFNVTDMRGEDIERAFDRRLHAQRFAYRLFLGFLILGFSASSLNASKASPRMLSSHSRNSTRPSRRTE
jgi:hypothetical protein